jgi:hypothetical protein
VRRGVLIGVAALLTLAAVLGLLAFFNSRDDATIGEDKAAPGKADPSLTDERLERGNVVILYGRPADREGLEALAREVSGPSDAALSEAGQAIIIERTPSEGIIATAYRRTLTVRTPDDPVLREFIEYWLGRGAS